MTPFRDAEAVLLIAASVLACAVGAYAALARTAPEDPDVAALLVGRLDTDGDGALSPAEFARVGDGVVPFAVADLDRSGALEAWECEALLVHVSPLAMQKNFLPMVR